MLMWVAMLMSAVHAAIKGHVWVYGPIPVGPWPLLSTEGRAMSVVYPATEGQVWVLFQMGAVLMSMTPVTTEGHVMSLVHAATANCDLCCCQEP